jgi:hypothetical protein
MKHWNRLTERSRVTLGAIVASETDANGCVANADAGTPDFLIRVTFTSCSTASRLVRAEAVPKWRPATMRREITRPMTILRRGRCGHGGLPAGFQVTPNAPPLHRRMPAGRPRRQGGTYATGKSNSLTTRPGFAGTPLDRPALAEPITHETVTISSSLRRGADALRPGSVQALAQCRPSDAGGGQEFPCGWRR